MLKTWFLRTQSENCIIAWNFSPIPPNFRFLIYSYPSYLKTFVLAKAKIFLVESRDGWDRLITSIIVPCG